MAGDLLARKPKRAGTPYPAPKKRAGPNGGLARPLNSHSIKMQMGVKMGDRTQVKTTNALYYICNLNVSGGDEGSFVIPLQRQENKGKIAIDKMLL